jgi:hypothetical protein
VKLTKDPDGRAAMGNSSGGSAALIMAWFRNDLYHRVLTTSGTFVNQAWPFDPKYPDGAWGFHETLIPNCPRKPIRLFISVGDADLLNPNVMRDGMHDWVEANHRMAKVLKAKGYEYQYLFCRGARHSVGNAQQQFLPHAIEWVWKGYAPKDDVVLHVFYTSVDGGDTLKQAAASNVGSAVTSGTHIISAQGDFAPPPAATRANPTPVSPWQAFLAPTSPDKQMLFLPLSPAQLPAWVPGKVVTVSSLGVLAMSWNPGSYVVELAGASESEAITLEPSPTCPRPASTRGSSPSHQTHRSRPVISGCASVARAAWIQSPRMTYRTCSWY